MGVTKATLAGHRATSASVNIPAWGCWFADATLDEEVTLAGEVSLVLNDLTLKGTVVSGGPYKGRSSFRIAGGSAGWGKSIKAQSYTSDAGVKMLTVLADAATAAGEKLDAATVPKSSIGPSFVRPEGPAARVLENLSQGAWYVGEDGVTRLGRRAAKKLEGSFTHGTLDRSRGTVQVIAESIAKILPGVIVDGLEAVDVQHEVGKDGLRSTIWGKASTAGTTRAIEAFRKILDQLDPFRKFRGVFEYRVVTLEGERVNLQPVRVSTGMPILRRVRIRPGVAGCKATSHLGARVLVAFVDSDPTRPEVVSHEDADGEGFLPTALALDASVAVRLGAGARPAIGAGDLAGGIWPCAPAQTKVLI